jgi:hypothetical protein
MRLNLIDLIATGESRMLEIERPWIAQQSAIVLPASRRRSPREEVQ